MRKPLLLFCLILSLSACKKDEEIILSVENVSSVQTLWIPTATFMEDTYTISSKSDITIKSSKPGLKVTTRKLEENKYKAVINRTSSDKYYTLTIKNDTESITYDFKASN